MGHRFEFLLKSVLPATRTSILLSLFLLVFTIPRGNGHVASALSGAPGGGDGKAPLSLSHIRLSRGPSGPVVPHTDDEDEGTAAKTHFLKPPTYQHKYLQRLSQFHGNDRDRGFGSAPIFDTNNYGDGIWMYNPAAADDDSIVNDQDPTYTPFIGARALSNIPKFFEHLRANIEALQKADGESDQGDKHNSAWTDIGSPVETSGERRSSEEESWFPRQGQYYQHWAAPLTNHNMRSFHNQPLDRPRHSSYNPSWQYTNLGLGRRR